MCPRAGQDPQPPDLVVVLPGRPPTSVSRRPSHWPDPVCLRTTKTGVGTRDHTEDGSRGDRRNRKGPRTRLRVNCPGLVPVLGQEWSGGKTSGGQGTLTPVGTEPVAPAGLPGRGPVGRDPHPSHPRPGARDQRVHRAKRHDVTTKGSLPRRRGPPTPVVVTDTVTHDLRRRTTPVDAGGRGPPRRVAVHPGQPAGTVPLRRRVYRRVLRGEPVIDTESRRTQGRKWKRLGRTQDRTSRPGPRGPLTRTRVPSRQGRRGRKQEDGSPVRSPGGGLTRVSLQNQSLLPS